jgi:hypothetical protein
MPPRSFKMPSSRPSTRGPCTRQNFAFYLPVGDILRGWLRSSAGHTAEGIAWIEDGIRRHCTIGSMLTLPVWLAAKAEALYFADRTSEALEAIREAEARAERSEERAWSAELYRFRGVFLTAIGADETQIEASFCEAIRIAKEQKSVSLQKRADATYAEYRRQKEKRREATVSDSLFVNFWRKQRPRKELSLKNRKLAPEADGDAPAGTSREAVKEAVEAADAVSLAVHWSGSTTS